MINMGLNRNYVIGFLGLNNNKLSDKLSIVMHYKVCQLNPMY